MKLTLKLIIFMAYLNMTSRVTIGQVVFKNINEFEISESVTDISDKATITLPRNYKDLLGKKVTDYIKAGDEVLIEAGYNGKLNQEYKGYVSEAPMADIPLVINCDELFKLRQGNIATSYRSVTLKTLLQQNIKGYTIECPGVQLGKVLLDNVTPYQMLEDLRKNFGFYSKVYNGNLLHIGWAYDWQNNYTKKHQLVFASNIKSSRNLKFKHKEDFNTKVRIVIHKPDGSKQEIIVGSKNRDAAVVTQTTGDISTAVAKQMGESIYKKASYDGFEGTVTAYGIPLIHAGDSIEFVSKKFPERNGVYLAEKVTKKYTEGGWEREIKIGFKLS